MDKITSIIKSCDIKNVLCNLLAGLPAKKVSQKFERYYSLYCAILEIWIATESPEIIITSYKQTDCELGKPAYSFFGIDANYGEPFRQERPINWRYFVEGKVEILFPSYLLDMIDRDLLSVEIICQIDEELSTTLPVRHNQYLFDEIIKSCKTKKARLYAIKKSIEKSLYYSADKRFIENSILEYHESKCMVIKWGDVLKKNDDSLIDHLIRNLHGTRILQDMIDSDALSPLYNWFMRLDKENPPDIQRCQSRNENLTTEFENIELADYLNALEMRMRIIIEQNPFCPELPLVYVLNKYGNKVEFSKADISQILSMDIYVIDKNINDPYHALAIIFYYMEYPLRAARIQREHAIQSLLGIISKSKMKSDIK